MPARDTVAGVAARKCPISKSSLMDGVRGTRSLLARVNTYIVQQPCAVHCMPSLGV